MHDQHDSDNVLNLGGSGPFLANPDPEVPITAEGCTVAAFPPVINGTASEAMGWTTNFSDDANLGVFDQPNLSALGVNWISPQYQEDVDWNAILAGFNTNSQLGEETRNEVVIQVEPTHAVDLHQQQQQSQQQSHEVETTQSPNFTVSGASSKSADNAYYVDGDGARAPFGGRICGRGLIVADHQQPEVLSDDSISSPSTLATMSRCLCPQAAYDNLIHHISSERQYCDLGPSFSSFPSISQVQIYVRYYFDYFHPIFPFLRKSSFSHIVSSEWLLLLAVAVVGSRYTLREQEADSGDMLLTTLDAALRLHKYELGLEHTARSNDLFLPGESATIHTCPYLATLQASILNVLLLQHSGRRSLVERALLERHYLVEACHSRGLISRKPPTEHGSCAEDCTGRDVVRCWLERESKIRTGMMIWVVLNYTRVPTFANSHSSWTAFSFSNLTRSP